MDSVHAHMMGLPGFAEAHLAKQQAVRDAQLFRPPCNDPLLIPVAVHFQNTGIPMACAIDMALSQVESLNADFAGANGDITEWNNLQPSIWPGISNGESCIQFCLATLNHPGGSGLLEGDYAVTLDQTSGDFDAAWSGYLNFFVYDIGGGTLGYSPLGGNGNGDGVTCDPAYFGSISCGGNNISAPYNMGRTVTHEVGHYLFLEHPWGNGGCASDDFVNDTPVTDAAQYGCPAGQTIVNCTDAILWPSYMDYCDDACLFMFSQGQVDRMETYVEQNLQGLLSNAATQCQEAACIGFDLAVSAVDESCTGGDGEVALSALGGTAPFTFTLDGVEVSGGEFTGLVEGSYGAMVVDANGCDAQASIALSRVGPDLELVQAVDEYCSDAAGRIEVVANEPSAFTFELTGDTALTGGSGLFEGLYAGAYDVVASNATGCEGTVPVVLVNGSDLGVSVTEYDVNCTWFENGRIEVKAFGGMEPYSYVLDGETMSPDGIFTTLSAGAHGLMVADSDGCLFEAEYTLGYDYASIGDDCPCMVYVPSAITPDNDGLNDVLAVSASCSLTNYELRIFDRWGEEVFRTLDPDAVWNGGVDAAYVRDGLYMFRVTYSWGSDEGASVRSESQTGSVQVIR
jgi:gliding motility-associated-like protein